MSAATEPARPARAGRRRAHYGVAGSGRSGGARCGCGGHQAGVDAAGRRVRVGSEVLPENGISEVHGECILMFAQPQKFFAQAAPLDVGADGQIAQVILSKKPAFSVRRVTSEPENSPPTSRITRHPSHIYPPVPTPPGVKCVRGGLPIV